jgi:class 3 adenylate cyclase/tetratricopeptide (TPR) repeat protein
MHEGQGRPEAHEQAETSLRQVTVMFADLTGFTQLSSELDPEDLHRVLSRFFATVDEIIERFGGTVEKHLGDGVMGIFGVPQAHSNDPQRAVRAALAIHAAMPGLGNALQQPLQVHVGIASGQVLIAEAGRQHTVTGQSVNLASRLSDLAAPGETLISEAVRAALGDRVRAEKVGDTEVKGIPAPVRVWRVHGFRGDADADRGHPLVGRRAELQQLEGLLAACATGGRGFAVYIRGEAGIGKTRLVEEVGRRAAARNFARHIALILDFGSGRGRDAIRSLARSLLHAPGSGSGGDAVDATVAAGSVGSDRQVFLNDLLELPQPEDLRRRFDAMDGTARRRGIQETLVELIRSSASRRPILLAIEDVHWAGSDTLEMLQGLVAAVEECPALLLMTARTEDDPFDRAWRAAVSVPLVTIDLQALRCEEATELASLYGDPESSFILDCVERAGGNPLFLEQLLRSAEIDGDGVPGSVQSVVLARMDRLERSDRDALQAASVMGQRFSLAALRHLTVSSGYDCEGLIREVLVRPEGDGYLFAHALVRDAVYASLLKSRRQELHRRAAEWFEVSDLGLHAQHLDRAEDPEAADAYLRAAREEAAIHRNEWALQLAERGLQIAQARPLSFDLACLRGHLLRGMIDASLEAFECALELADDEAARGSAWIGLAEAMRIVDRYDEALGVLDKAEAALAGVSGAVQKRAEVHELRGNIYFPLGRIERCLAEHEKALAAAREANFRELEARALGGLGDAEYARGRIRTSHQHFSRCVELCREHGFGRVEVVYLPMIGNNLGFLNDPRGARDAAYAAIEAARSIGHLRAELIARHVVFASLRELDEIIESRAHIERAQTLVERLGARRFVSENLTYLAQIERTEGRTDAALAHLGDALAIARSGVMGYFGPTILGTLALIADDPEVRQGALREGEAVLEAGAVSHNYLWFYRDAMEASLNTGGWHEAERYAALVEEYTRPEPLPWSEFYVARGRALAAHGRGARDEGTAAKLRRLRDEAGETGLRAAIPAINMALASCG